jgi:hypothetical protein
VTESPPGFDQAFPRGVVDRSGEWQPARTLERFDQGERAVAERVLSVVRREMSEGGEALV